MRRLCQCQDDLIFTPLTSGYLKVMGFPGGSDGKESACHVEDPGLIPGLGRCPGEGNGYPLQYSCLENPMDRGAWQATVHGGCKESDTTDTNTFNKGYSNIFQKCMSHFKMEYRNKRPQKAAVFFFYTMTVNTETEIPCFCLCYRLLRLSSSSRESLYTDIVLFRLKEE